MPAARYWRLTGVESDSGALSLMGAAVHSTSGRVDGSATLTSNIAPTTGSAAQLVAGGQLVRWADASSPGFALVWDFGASTDVHKFVIAAGALASEFARAVTVSYSSNGMNWTTITTKVDIAYPGDGLTVEVGAYDSDPTPSNVELLLGGDAFVDSSPRNRTVTPGASTAIVASSRNGANSIAFDGEAASEMGVAVDSNMNLTGLFTVEFWVYPLSYTNNFGTIIGSGSTGPWGAGQFVFRFHKRDGLYPGRLAMVTNDASYVVESTITPALNQWHHVAFTRDASNVVRLYINGVLDASRGYGSALNFGSWATARVGGLFFGDSVHRFHGYIDDLRVTKGVCRYSASSFDLPTYDFGRPTVSTAYAARPLKTPAPSVPSLSVFEPGPTTLNTTAMLPVLDIHDGGKGRIVGTVKEKNLPDNTPLRRRVVLLNYNDQRKVRETWSDAATGAYAFNEIDLNRKYTVIAFDHTEAYRAVIADNLTPEVMT